MNSKLEEILTEVVEVWMHGDHVNDYQHHLANFAKKHIYPKYKDELVELKRITPTKEQLRIEKFFENHG